MSNTVARSARISVPHLEAWPRPGAGRMAGAVDCLGRASLTADFMGHRSQKSSRRPDADAVLLVDPSAGLVDPDLIDGLIEHAESRPEIDLCFSQAAPGLSGALLRKTLFEQLAVGGAHPGTLLCYRPDLPVHDPISSRPVRRL